MFARNTFKKTIKHVTGVLLLLISNTSDDSNALKDCAFYVLSRSVRALPLN